MNHPLASLEFESLRRLTGSLRRLVETRLWLRVIAAMFAGVLTGVALGPSVGWVDPDVATVIASWLSLPGSLFLTLVQMIVVPLVFASVIRGLAASDTPSELQRLGLRAVAFFVVTTALAVGLGLGLGALVQPGAFVDPKLVSSVLGGTGNPGVQVPAMPGMREIPDTLIQLLPRNPLESLVGAQMLQVILFAVIMGVALINIDPEKSRPLFELLGSLQEVCMKVVSWAMRLAPLAVFGLITRLTATVGVEVLLGMAVYVGTVLAGLAIMLVVLVLLAWSLAARPPIAFVRDLREVILLAFSTSSSAAVMPLSIQTAEDSLGVRTSISRFVIPLGATINMNGTALYQGVATMFLAQIFDVQLGSTGVLFVVVTSVLASIGSPATPGAGIVILGMVLEGVGIPASGLALLLGVDRILDMSRTAVNVTGDLTACAILERYSEPDPT